MNKQARGCFLVYIYIMLKILLEYIMDIIIMLYESLYVIMN